MNHFSIRTIVIAIVSASATFTSFYGSACSVPRSSLLPAKTVVEKIETSLEDFMDSAYAAKSQRVAQACTIGCWGKFSSEQDIVCHAATLDVCVMLTYCSYTCK